MVIGGQNEKSSKYRTVAVKKFSRKHCKTGTTSTNMSAADVNADGVVDVKDVIELQQFLLVERDVFSGSMRKNIEPPDTSIVTTNQPIETSLTAQMAEKAKELGTAVNVYNYLYNNMRSEFYYGSRKGAIGTFEQGGGNDADLSSLLIAMLRYLGYDANYVTDIVGFSAEQLMKWTNTDSIEAATKIYSCQGRENTTYEYEGVTYYFCDYTYVQLVDADKTYYIDVCFKEYESQKNSIQTLSSEASASDVERLLQKNDLERMTEGEWMAIDSYLKDGHSIYCTINDIEFSDEEIKSILSALHEGYPDLQVEIWTLNGKFS